MAKAKAEVSTVKETTKKYSVPVYSVDGKAGTSLSLPETSLESKVSDNMISQVVRVMLSRLHQDTVYTKDRSEVRGGGKKPWRQKGTGRARQGSIRSPQWVGGGVVHGPKGNGRELMLPKKWSKSVVTELLRKLVLTENLVVVEELSFKEPKTKEVINLIKNINLEGKVLVVAQKVDANLLLSIRNAANTKVTSIVELSALDLLKTDKVVVDKESFEVIKKRLEGVSVK